MAELAQGGGLSPIGFGDTKYSLPGRSRAVSGILFKCPYELCDHSSRPTIADGLKRRYPKARRGSLRSALPQKAFLFGLASAGVYQATESPPCW